MRLTDSEHVSQWHQGAQHQIWNLQSVVLVCSVSKDHCFPSQTWLPVDDGASDRGIFYGPIWQSLLRQKSSVPILQPLHQQSYVLQQGFSHKRTLLEWVRVPGSGLLKSLLLFGIFGCKALGKLMTLLYPRSPSPTVHGKVEGWGRGRKSQQGHPHITLCSHMERSLGLIHRDPVPLPLLYPSDASGAALPRHTPAVVAPRVRGSPCPIDNIAWSWSNRTRQGILPSPAFCLPSVEEGSMEEGCPGWGEKG